MCVCVRVRVRVCVCVRARGRARACVSSVICERGCERLPDLLPTALARVGISLPVDFAGDTASSTSLIGADPAARVGRWQETGRSGGEDAPSESKLRRKTCPQPDLTREVAGSMGMRP